MASAVDDFCTSLLLRISQRQFVDNEYYPALDAATEGKVDLTYTQRNRDSFKACLQQMAGAGIDAFVTAATSMERIQNSSAQLPDAISAAIETLLSEDNTWVENVFPEDLNTIHDLTRTCLCVPFCVENTSLQMPCFREASKAAEKAFQTASGTAQEILESATRQVCT